MNTQPEALRLADALQRAAKQLDPEDHVAQIADWFLEDAAAELCRLQALNDELLEALKAIIGDQPEDKYGYFAAHNVMDDDKRQAARAAIAKATGEQK